MPQSYAEYQFRLHVCSPVAADSPFESDTLWGRVICALLDGTDAERQLAMSWLKELDERQKASQSAWQPPLIVSEGFQCDGNGIPWLPLPFGISLSWQTAQSKPHISLGPNEVSKVGLSRKDLKRIEWLPLDQFAELCAGKPADVGHFHLLQTNRPRTRPALQPHIGMDRASGSSAEGLLYMIGLDVYQRPESAGQTLETSQSQGTAADATAPEKVTGSALPEIAFFLKLREDVDPVLLGGALKRICDEGWGRAKSRGLGYLRFKTFEKWNDKPAVTSDPDGFVSLSHFCPSQSDPTEGFWKLMPKHPVPPQFVDGRRVALGAGTEWRVKSFLRLRAGSCFRLDGEQVSEHYGRLLTGLLHPSKDSDGNDLPELFHYALAYPWPMMLSQELHSGR